MSHVNAPVVDDQNHFFGFIPETKYEGGQGSIPSWDFILESLR